MAKRKLEKATRFERMFRIWDYLRKNTDNEHPTTQAKMRKDESVAEYIGDKQTFNRLIKDMARAMNSEEHDYKPEEEWKIFFDDFVSEYGDESDVFEMDDYDDFTDKSMRIDNLYYKRTFSYEEVNCLIEGILAIKSIDSQTARELIEKVEDNLTTRFYKKGPTQIFKVCEPELMDGEKVRENLLIIQQAIDNNVQISFRFNGYTHKKKLAPVRAVKDTVSPYYIVASNGKYYLLACKEVSFNGKEIKRMSIWRVDLMTELEIPGADEKLGIHGIRRIPKRDVENLPSEWSEDFQLKHLNMSYDKPVWITLRIKSKKSESDPTHPIAPDYTFLHDWFGNNFRYVETEKEPPYYDIVKVECSPYGMVNWALQYSDRVEVLEPAEVREMVVAKVKALREKYRNI